MASLRGQSTSTQNSLVFDAMGEIRDVYPRKLIKEILDSGLNAITVTLCDPKTFEHEAFEAAKDGILHYDHLIAKYPDLYTKAIKVSDINISRQEGKLAIFYLFQNSTQFSRDLDLVDTFYELGVRSTQITYNYQNWAGAGCKERTGAGLTYFGLELVEKMNEVFEIFPKCTRKSRKSPESAFCRSTALRGISRFPTSRPHRHPYIEIP